MGFALQIIENLDGIKDSVSYRTSMSSVHTRDLKLTDDLASVMNDNCASYNAYATADDVDTMGSGI